MFLIANRLPFYRKSDLLKLLIYLPAPENNIEKEIFSNCLKLRLLFMLT